MSTTARVAVLASGRGSNLQALLDAASDPWFPADIVKVVCNVPGVIALDRARAAGLPTEVVVSRGRTREDFEAELLSRLDGVDIVCLAGFMRVLTPLFLDQFPARVMNIHPALLPAFPGAHGIADALSHGVTVAGATCHLVDSGVDTGPILAQGAVAVHDEDTVDTLAARVLGVEHRLYPLCLRWMAEGRVTVEGQRARVRLLPGESRWIAG